MLALLVFAPVLAQSSNLVLEDETGQLDRSRIEQAAAPLLERGATVAVYMVSEPQNNFEQHLQNDNLMSSDGRLRQGLIAVYINAQTRHANMRFEGTWSEALAVNDNYESILQSEVPPNMSEGNPTAAFVETLQAVEQSIESPPVPGGGNIFNVNFMPVVIGAFVMLFLVVGGVTFVRRRSAEQALEKARTGADEARQAAGAAIAEMGERLRNANEKAQYDRLSYDPQDVQRLADAQQQIAAHFAQAQQQFNQIEDDMFHRQKPEVSHYDQTTQAYQQVQQAVLNLREELDKLDRQRLELDQLAEQTRNDLENSKKVLTDVAEKAASLQGDIANTDAVVAPVRQRLEQAGQALEANRARQAGAEVQAASELAQQMIGALETYAAIRAGIVQGRNDAERLAAEGFRMETSNAALDRAHATLQEIAQVLQSGNTQAIEHASEGLRLAQQALDEATANGRDLVALRQENERRLSEIEQQGQRTAHIIAEGRKTFDKVDDFAESTWSDIRGNGSEAQAAANRAEQHWNSAREQNSMEVQEFAAAREDLDSASEELTYAQNLIEAITERLVALEEARDTARQELQDAENDITRGWQFIKSNDPDVGKIPEKQLHEASRLLTAARAEMQKDKPNWLLLVEKAQEANNLADEALAGARSEAEAMAKLRGKAERAHKVASSEVQRIVKFANLHNEDIQQATRNKLAQLQQQVQQAAGLLRRAEETEEEQRQQALEQAYATARGIEQESAQVYQAAQQDVQRLEQMRAELNKELTSARNTILVAEQELTSYTVHKGSEVKTLRGVRRRFEQIKLPITGEANIRSKISLARALQQDATEVIKDIRQRHHNSPRHHHGGHHHHGSDVGDIVTGVALGMLFDAATRGGGWGGSGSWSGGGGGDSGGGWGDFGGGGGIDFGGGGGGIDFGDFGGGIDW
jgi:hypothetical protein